MNVTEIAAKDITPITQLRLAAYCRVSSNSADQLHSFAAQIRYYKEYEKKHPEYTLVGIYADEGLSGTCLDKRDEQNRLLHDCKRGKIDRIIVKSVSRFARNTEELLAMLRALKEVGVSVYFEEQGIDTNKLNMEMIVTFPGMAAQQESESISGNMRWSYQKRMASGTFNCCTPAYGYDLTNGELVINEAEAAIVRRVFDRYLQGASMLTIANELTADGIPRKYGYQKWSYLTIRYMLNNERYIGDALLQKKYTTDSLPFKQKRNHGERPQYYVENANPAIISKAIFTKVKELQAQRISGTERSKKQYPLSGMLRCPDCGRTFRRLYVHGSAYWICSAQASSAKNCTRRRVREESVYEAFRTLVDKLSTFRGVILVQLIHDIEIMLTQSSGNHLRITEIDSELANLAAQNLVITRLHNNGILSAMDFAAQSSDIAAKITALRSERKRKLKEDANDEHLDKLKSLHEVVSEYTPSREFDEALFDAITEYIVIISNSEICFHLIGGLTLTETIDERGRCRTT